MNLYELMPRFRALFQGRPDAFGTGSGQWIKRPPTAVDWLRHLEGNGPGIGIAPLFDDGTVNFAAIDLDEPDFAAALEMQSYIPGPSFVERSRSGNAHCWVFFNEPIQAWLARGILKEAHLAAGKKIVEIFPKQDRLRPGMFGNYINLPFHGDQRPILFNDTTGGLVEDDLEGFIYAVEHGGKNSPKDWEKRAMFLPNVQPPSERTQESAFGAQPVLHMCAEHIIANRDENPVVEGHRNAVYFALACQLTNYSEFNHEEAFAMMKLVNDSSPHRTDERELLRILRNAEQGEFTSTRCDDPLVLPYTHPNCPIAKGGR